MTSDETGIVDIRGRSYKTVALRVKEFREAHPDYTIKTKILSAADVVQMKATISDPAGRVLATGHAEEKRGQGDINATSSLENCETSATGRALAFLGLGGMAISSLDEMAAAARQLEDIQRLMDHNTAVRDHIESIVAIKAYLLNDEYGLAYEAIAEIPQDDAKSLWIAPSRGGVWTTEERAKMKSDEWAAARKDHHA